MFNPDSYTETFSRDTGCTEAEWLSRLPGACGCHALKLGPDSATISLPGGQLKLNWQELPPRQIALARLPRLLVDYRFSGVSALERQRFMRLFDLHMQRGGG